MVGRPVGKVLGKSDGWLEGLSEIVGNVVGCVDGTKQAGRLVMTMVDYSASSMGNLMAIQLVVS